MRSLSRVRPVALVLALGICAGFPAESSAADCKALRGTTWQPPIKAYDQKAGSIRVFAIQFKQEVRHVSTYRSFADKLECTIKDDVVPNISKGHPNVVLLNEDIGLMAFGIGSRGALARTAIATEGALSVPGRLKQGYSSQVRWYRAKFGAGAMGSTEEAFVSATDTQVRAFAETFSSLARKFKVYIGGSSMLPNFAESTSSKDIDALRDPDTARPKWVYVATGPHVFNRAILWGPKDVRGSGPHPLRNSVLVNDKVPLTSIEQVIEITPGPSTGAAAKANLRPFTIPGTSARVQFATSLPAFRFGSPAAGHECDDTSVSYMRCLDSLGANTVLQDEANPGQWASPPGFWQPSEWMDSTWRTVSDPSVHFLYNVTPMLVGNLADLAFDGQSAITARGLTGGGCRYVGDGIAVAGDGDIAGNIGPKPEFLALTPWVRGDADRATLRTASNALLRDAGGPRVNDYLETSIAADLTYPVDRSRRNCVTAAAPR